MSTTKERALTIVEALREAGLIRDGSDAEKAVEVTANALIRTDPPPPPPPRG